jgi:hypothetical protein
MARASLSHILVDMLGVEYRRIHLERQGELPKFSNGGRDRARMNFPE